MSDLNFDRFQFEGKRTPPVSPSTCLAFSDFVRMQVDHQKTFRNRVWIPAFANDDEQLRAVLAHAVGRYRYGALGFGKNTPTDWKELEHIARETFYRRRVSHAGIKLPPLKLREWDSHVRAVTRAGNYLALLAAIAYRSWRLGQDSVTVGASLDMAPPAVRQHLMRLCQYARALGLETFARRKKTGRKLITTTVTISESGLHISRRHAARQPAHARYSRKRKVALGL
jgi:hypothetical protein